MPVPVDLQQVFLVGDDSAGGEIRALQVTHQLSGGDVFIAHVGLHGVHHLPQVVGRRAGGHAHRDALGAVYEKIGELHRQDGRLLLRLIEIRDEIHHVLVQIGQVSLLGHPLQPGLGVTHGRGPVPLDIAEVAVAVHKRQPTLEILGHDYKSLVYGAVSMGMVFTHGIAHDTGALSIRPVIADAQLVHIVKRPPLHRLQTVPHIRQRPGDDDAHGVIDEGLLHLLGIFCFYDSAVFHLFPTLYASIIILPYNP